jgi:glycosyltransferase involved in cell wall biosynthesis
MKKVLIISYKFPPDPNIGGFRIHGLAKYLPEFGWEPIILTTPLPRNPNAQFRVIQTPYYDVIGTWKKRVGLKPEVGVKKQFGITAHKNKKSLLDYILIFLGEIIAYPDAHKGWYKYAVKAGSEIFKNENIDAMISSFSPITSHLIAKELKIKHKIPWVADFRDLWSQNHDYPYGYIRKFFDRRLELKTLLPADALVTVSPLWAEKLSALHGGKATYTITNGFDPVQMNTKRLGLTSKFTITYTGGILTGKQDPSKLFAALRDLISDGTMDPKDVEVRFYGHERDWLPSEIRKYGLSAIVRYYGMVPREISFEKQRESQLLLLLNWEDQREKGVYPLKVFEYLGAQRPILATGGFGKDMIERLLDETKVGVYAKEVEDIKGILSGLYAEYKRNGEITYNGNVKKINEYSYREMARKFAEVLDQVTSK